MEWPPELKLGFPERGGWVVLPPVSLPLGPPPSFSECVVFHGSTATAAAVASGTSLSLKQGRELPAATITLGKLAGFRLATGELELPTCHSVS